MGKPMQFGAPEWTPVPPSAEIPYLEIVWPRTNQPVAGYMLAERPEGCQCHWVPDHRAGARPTDGRTICCVGRANGCVYCTPAYGKKWQAYMPIVCGMAGRIFLAQISKEAARTCPPLSDPRRNLRGSWLRMERLGAAANGRVQAEVVVAVASPNLPKSPNIRQSLERIWSLAPIMYPLADLVAAGDHAPALPLLREEVQGG